MWKLYCIAVYFLDVGVLVLCEIDYFTVFENVLQYERVLKEFKTLISRCAFL